MIRYPSPVHFAPSAFLTPGVAHFLPEINLGYAILIAAADDKALPYLVEQPQSPPRILPLFRAFTEIDTLMRGLRATP